MQIQISKKLPFFPDLFKRSVIIIKYRVYNVHQYINIGFQKWPADINHYTVKSLVGMSCSDFGQNTIFLEHPVQYKKMGENVQGGMKWSYGRVKKYCLKLIFS